MFLIHMEEVSEKVCGQHVPLLSQDSAAFHAHASVFATCDNDVGVASDYDYMDAEGGFCGTFGVAAPRFRDLALCVT